MRIGIIICFYFFFVNLNLQAQRHNIDPLTIVDGEELCYKVYYNWKFVWVPAGEVWFKTVETEQHIELHVSGISYPSYDSFFKVRDDYVSRINKVDFLPDCFRRNVLEGSYQRYDSLDFDRETNIVKEYFGTTNQSADEFVYQMDTNVLDVVSALYFVRGLDLKSMKSKKEIIIPLFFDKELHNVAVLLKGLNKKKIKSIGKVNAIQMEVSLLEGTTFNESDKMNIWISEDGQVPLQIESPLKVGSVKAVLKSVEGRDFNYDFKI